MTDIWRSFIAQKICFENGWSVLFHEPTVWQERNAHNLMQDFEDETPGYVYNAELCAELEGLHLKPGAENTVSNLRLSYQKLVELSLIRQEELELLDLWIHDFNQTNKCKKWSEIF